LLYFVQESCPVSLCAFFVRRFGITFIRIFIFWYVYETRSFQYSRHHFYTVFFPLIFVFGYRNYRCTSTKIILKQSGAWDIDNEIIKSKIQAITTSTVIWHKNLNIGFITLHTAGGNLSFQLDYSKSKKYVNLWFVRN
jgi:putative membrane protein